MNLDGFAEAGQQASFCDLDDPAYCRNNIVCTNHLRHEKRIFVGLLKSAGGELSRGKYRESSPRTTLVLPQ